MLDRANTPSTLYGRVFNHEEHEDHEGKISCNVGLRVLRGEIKFIRIPDIIKLKIY